MTDNRNTQEIVTDFFGGLTSLGARGVDGLIIARAVVRLLIQKGILSEDEMVAMMREVATQELEKADTIFLLEAFKEILSRLGNDKTNED
ncbi:MAG: hypothetical protein CUN55_03290 [Phototrophicales bacterium]|nr:MAG: hypothetical protein CUN55_03290 [Phototrophicales bacterium]